MFDEPDLTNKLRLRLRSGLRLRVLVDRQQLKRKTEWAKRSLDRLDKLRKAGAQVFLCSGCFDEGCFHNKELVVDKRFYFGGSANFTHAARNYNKERCFFATGPEVASVLADLQEERERAVLWDGRSV